MALVKVARRGSSGPSCAINWRATACASGPLRRRTPMPPRPGGVAMATMVSAVENILVAGGWWLVAGHQPPSFPQRDVDGFRKRVADALRRHARHFGDGDMHDAALVR